ncbi:hypothetical protein [Halioxenophilus sp. WMMB6]|uniref:hypothetical protein n=1 Tax=Halioxenophilus sp. WMMB6 TaxID=3073815 RepID=UPI00295E4FAD|nr:hypothetical protein [Halioxenophilus sp. WMMB6]
MQQSQLHGGAYNDKYMICRRYADSRNSRIHVLLTSLPAATKLGVKLSRAVWA